MESYLIQQNARFKAFIVSELLRENQQGGWGALRLTTNTTRDVENVAKFF